MTEQETSQPRPVRTKGRSPSYPAIDLKTAIDRARQLYEREHQYATPIPTIYEHWGYKASGGSGNLAVAALRKFGLLAYEGSGEARRAKLTNLAVEIIGHPDERERREAVKKAALMPTIHQELWKEYGAKLPSDEHIRWKLRQERGFTSTGADEFIPQYRATLAFAGLTGVAADSEVTEPIDHHIEDDGVDADAATVYDANLNRTILVRSEKVRSYLIPVVPGTEILIEGPFPVSEEDWQSFITVLNAMKIGLVRRAEPASGS